MRNRLTAPNVTIVTKIAILAQQQPAVLGADQGRYGAGEKPGVDQSAGEQNRDADRGQNRKSHRPPAAPRRRNRIAVSTIIGQQQRQRDQRPDPGAGGEQMEHVGGEVQIARAPRCRCAMSGPGKRRERTGGKRKPAPAPPPPAPALRHQQQALPGSRREQIAGSRLARTGCGSAPSPRPPASACRRSAGRSFAPRQTAAMRRPTAAPAARLAQATSDSRRRSARRRLRAGDKAEEGEDPRQRYRRGVVNRARRDQEAFHRLLRCSIALALPTPGAHPPPTVKVKCPVVVWVSTERACHATL